MKDRSGAAGSQATAKRVRGRRATLLRYTLGLAAVGAVVYYFVRERDLFAGFGTAVSGLNWYFVVVAFAAELASVPPVAAEPCIVTVTPSTCRLSAWPKGSPSSCRMVRLFRRLAPRRSFAVAEANDDIRRELDRFGLTDKIGPDRYFDSLHAARDAFHHA